METDTCELDCALRFRSSEGRKRLIVCQIGHNTHLCLGFQMGSAAVCWRLHMGIGDGPGLSVYYIHASLIEKTGNDLKPLVVHWNILSLIWYNVGITVPGTYWVVHS